MTDESTWVYEVTFKESLRFRTEGPQEVLLGHKDFVSNLLGDGLVEHTISRTLVSADAFVQGVSPNLNMARFEINGTTVWTPISNILNVTKRAHELP
jgi:hypothetical protein